MQNNYSIFTSHALAAVELLEHGKIDAKEYALIGILIHRLLATGKKSAPFSRKEWANLSGLSQETVRKTIDRLCKKGYMKRSRQSRRSGANIATRYSVSRLNTPEQTPRYFLATPPLKISDPYIKQETDNDNGGAGVCSEQLQQARKFALEEIDTFIEWIKGKNWTKTDKDSPEYQATLEANLHLGDYLTLQNALKFHLSHKQQRENPGKSKSHEEPGGEYTARAGAAEEEVGA